MSAPAMKMSGLPLMSTAARTAVSPSRSSKTRVKSSMTARLRVFTGAFGSSIVTIATSPSISRRSVVKAGRTAVAVMSAEDAR